MERFRCFGLLDGRHLRVNQAALTVVTLVFAGLPIAAAAQREASGAA